MIMTETQSMHKIKRAVEYMRPFFDVVRFVDTTKTKVIVFNRQTNEIKESERCYKLWHKEERCENCTSMSALLEGCQKEEYEFRDNEVYHVISRPVNVLDETGKVHTVILEIINGVSDTALFEKYGISNTGDKTIIGLIEETYRKIYEDPLTSVYNRRYLDEYLFLYHNSDKVFTKVAFIMADLKKFKRINDTMGHEIGDRILIKTASVFKKNISSQDSVIRLGGDEFIIVLVNYSEKEVSDKVELLYSEVRKIDIDSQEQKYVDVDLGYSYTESFVASKECVDDMLKQADRAMYTVKNAHTKERYRDY